jgi:hypothetical protein
MAISFVARARFFWLPVALCAAGQDSSGAVNEGLLHLNMAAPARSLNFCMMDFGLACPLRHKIKVREGYN